MIGIQGIPTGDTYYAAIKSIDDAGNRSALSNVVELTLGGGGDTTPPGSIDDLEVIFVTPSTVTLRWTATGDDGGIGTASYYEITHDVGCGGAPQSVANPPTPQPSGAAERFTITGLASSTNYCFSVRAFDDNSNGSPTAGDFTTTTASPFQVTTHDDDDRGPDWSPEGLRIAFGYLVQPGEMDIYMVNANGGDLTPITTQVGFESTPDWRPLHDQIAFRANWGTSLDIHMIDTNGANLTPIVEDEHWNSSPSWSPDGTRLAFSSGRDGNTDIWIVDVSGSSPGTLEKVTDDAGSDGEVEWSPDGSYFAIIRDNDVWVVSYPQRVYTRITSTVAAEKEVTWSYDSTWLAFVSDRNGSNDIFVVHRDGGEPFRVTYDLGTEGQPSWSPLPGSTRRIAYTSEQTNVGNIWIVEVSFD